MVPPLLANAGRALWRSGTGLSPETRGFVVARGVVVDDRRGASSTGYEAGVSTRDETTDNPAGRHSTAVAVWRVVAVVQTVSTVAPSARA